MNLISIKKWQPRHWVAATCALIIVVRALFPELRIDDISLWFFLLAALSILVPDLADVISRVKKIKQGDFELEFEGRLSELSRKTEETEEEIESSDLDFGELPDSVRDRITKAFVEPRAALITVAIEIESRLRDVAEQYNISHSGRFFSPRRTIQDLAEAGKVDKHLPSLFADFWEIRNQAIHGTNFVPEASQLFSLVDLGMRILRILYGISENNKSDQQEKI